MRASFSLLSHSHRPFPSPSLRSSLFLPFSRLPPSYSRPYSSSSSSSDDEGPAKEKGEQAQQAPLLGLANLFQNASKNENNQQPRLSGIFGDEKGSGTDEKPKQYFDFLKEEGKAKEEADMSLSLDFLTPQSKKEESFDSVLQDWTSWNPEKGNRPQNILDTVSFASNNLSSAGGTEAEDKLRSFIVDHLSVGDYMDNVDDYDQLEVQPLGASDETHKLQTYMILPDANDELTFATSQLNIKGEEAVKEDPLGEELRQKIRRAFDEEFPEGKDFSHGEESVKLKKVFNKLRDLIMKTDPSLLESAFEISREDEKEIASKDAEYRELEDAERESFGKEEEISIKDDTEVSLEKVLDNQAMISDLVAEAEASGRGNEEDGSAAGGDDEAEEGLDDDDDRSSPFGGRSFDDDSDDELNEKLRSICRPYLTTKIDPAKDFRYTLPNLASAMAPNNLSIAQTYKTILGRLSSGRDCKIDVREMDKRRMTREKLRFLAARARAKRAKRGLTSTPKPPPKGPLVVLNGEEYLEELSITPQDPHYYYLRELACGIGLNPHWTQDKVREALLRAKDIMENPPSFTFLPDPSSLKYPKTGTPTKKRKRYSR